MTPITARRAPKPGHGSAGVRSGAFAYFHDPQGSLFGKMNGHALRVAGIGFTVDTSGLIAELLHTASMQRTADIRQFDLKRNPMPMAQGRGGSGAPFRHTRLNHMVGAGAVSQLICHNNPQIPQEHWSTLTAYDATHDVSSMAGNDAVKQAKPGAFEEDEHYCTAFLGSEGVKLIMLRHGVDLALAAQLAREEHPTYKTLHDIVDRVSYISGDVEEFERLCEPIDQLTLLPEGHNLQRIFELSRPYKGQPIGSIWETVRFDENGPYFLDSEHLARFLELRANFFGGIYLSPNSRAADYLIGVILIRYLFEQGLIDLLDLLKMNDSGLLQYLEVVTGFNRFKAESDGLMRNPNRIVMTTVEAAARESARLAEAGNLTLTEDYRRASGSSTGWRVKQGRRIRPLREALQGRSETIERIMQAATSLTVHSIPSQALAEHGVREEVIQRLITFERRRTQH